MIDIKRVIVGDKVTYCPFEGCDKSLLEHGIIKKMPLYDYDQSNIWVVYNCDNDWENYHNYTAALTNIDNLEYGWV